MLFQVDIQKTMANEYWTNVYHCNSPDQAAAVVFAQDIVEVERDIHGVGVAFTSMRVRPFPGPSEGSIIALGGTGERAGGLWLPLFNVCRVDFPVAIGRPSRKYYRLPITEGEVEYNSFTPAFVAAIQLALDNWFLAPGPDPLCDVDGQPLTRAVVMSTVGMRQLRRGSKRKLEPVIPIA